MNLNSFKGSNELGLLIGSALVTLHYDEFIAHLTSKNLIEETIMSYICNKPMFKSCKGTSSV